MNKKSFIYFDNAATSYPKPKSVVSAMVQCMKSYCANPGRSGHKLALESNKILFDSRRKIADFFNVSDPLNVIITKNATESLNMIIKSLSEKKGHMVFTSYEHNSVIRTLYHYKKQGNISYDICIPDENGFIDPNKVEKYISKDTVALIVSLASNITGYILPIKELGEICKSRDIKFIVDVSQGAGTLRPDMKQNNIDIIAGTGHKDLYGPQGTGFICTNGSVNLTPLIYGGTGTNSFSPDPPVLIPEILEAGTVNLPGIVGLREGIKFLNSRKKESVIRHKNQLVSFMSDGLNNIKKITKYVPDNNCGIVSLDIKGMDSQEAVTVLSEKYGICTRGGFHCSPHLHNYLKTKDKGLVRFSFGLFNNKSEILYTLNVLELMTQSN